MNTETNRQREREKEEMGDIERKHKVDDAIIRWRISKREKYLNYALVAEEKYLQNPKDKHNLMSWASSLQHAARLPLGTKQDRAMLFFAAKSKLVEALRIDEKNFDARFQLGSVQFDILNLDIPFDRSETFIDLVEDAISNLNRVQKQAPGVLPCADMLRKLTELLPKGYSLPEIDYTEEDDELDEEVMAFSRLERDCMASKIETERNPANADSWRTWGSALTGLSFHYTSLNRKQNMLEDAIAMLKTAESMNPNDNHTKLELTKTLIVLGSLNGDECADLVPEYHRLNAEVFP